MSSENEFVGRDLRGARFAECDLSGVVMRGVEVSGMDIDAPWLVHGEPLLVNGVDVSGYVEKQLDDRFPGRADRRASTPEGLRAAWTAVEAAWRRALDRAAMLREGSVDVSVAGEWSFAQTLRHLVHATDLWLGRAVLERTEAFHALGLGITGPDEQAGVPAAADTPAYGEVLVAWDDRTTLVREFLATVTSEVLDQTRANPHAPQHPETVRSCLHVVLEESLGAPAIRDARPRHPCRGNGLTSARRSSDRRRAVLPIEDHRVRRSVIRWGMVVRPPAEETRPGHPL